MQNQSLPVRAELIRPGDDAPDFTLLDQQRNEWKLSDALKQGDVVLCFFPFAFTDVCSAEMKCVDDEIEAWKAKGTTVVGISCDSFAALNAWAVQMGLKQTLLADMHRKVCKAYGLYWPDLHVASRGTVVVDRTGKVKWSQGRQPGDAMAWEEVLGHAG
ncbi:MAG: redoxin domain-containing protein [Phycisphaerales bacterium]|nr:redoxin domain-containing protein [Phycisphaerales bacterium]